MPKYVIERELPGVGSLSANEISSDAEHIRRHAEEGGFPASAVHQVARTIDPTTGGR